MNHDPNTVAKQVPKVKELLIYIEKFTELDEFSDKDLEQPIGKHQEASIFYNPTEQEYMKRYIISEIVKCRCVETVRVLFKQSDNLEELRKDNPNLISAKIRFYNNPVSAVLAGLLSSMTLFLIPTWNANYISTEFEIYSPKSKITNKLKFDYSGTVIRHLFLLPWSFSEEHKMRFLFSRTIPGSFRSVVEEGYNKNLFTIEK